MCSALLPRHVPNITAITATRLCVYRSIMQVIQWEIGVTRSLSKCQALQSKIAGWFDVVWSWNTTRPIDLEMLYKKSFGSNSIRAIVRMQIAVKRRRLRQLVSDLCVNIATERFIRSRWTSKRKSRASQQLSKFLRKPRLLHVDSSHNGINQIYYDRKFGWCNFE